MTLTELYRELERHDWHYQRSDDFRIYQQGEFNQRRLKRAAQNIEGGEQLMSNYAKYVFSGPSFGISNQSKPECPTETTEPKQSEPIS